MVRNNAYNKFIIKYFLGREYEDKRRKKNDQASIFSQLPFLDIIFFKKHIDFLVHVHSS
jgi:hypothetical protein